MQNAVVSLAEVLVYENEPLLKAYAKKSGLALDEARELFIDLKKWLWLMGQHSSTTFRFPSYPEQAVIDLFWHEFILSTMEYTEFCHRFFGRYIHHVPTPDGVNGASLDLASRNMPEFVSRNVEVLDTAMREVYQKLGRETVVRWYRELPARYPQFR